jgi:hypothetical protein
LFKRSETFFFEASCSAKAFSRSRTLRSFGSSFLKPPSVQQKPFQGRELWSTRRAS